MDRDARHLHLVEPFEEGCCSDVETHVVHHSEHCHCQDDQVATVPDVAGRDVLRDYQSALHGQAEEPISVTEALYDAGASLTEAKTVAALERIAQALEALVRKS